MMIILGTWKKVDVKIHWKGYNNVDNLQELTIVNNLILSMEVGWWRSRRRCGSHSFDGTNQYGGEDFFIIMILMMMMTIMIIKIKTIVIHLMMMMMMMMMTKPA